MSLEHLNEDEFMATNLARFRVAGRFQQGINKEGQEFAEGLQ
jgi:hypothetical protein